MKILVTGGAGYIGSVLVPMLLQDGYKVRVLDNLMYDNGACMIPMLAQQGFEFMRGDIREDADVRAAMKGMDVVIHLAAIVGFPACRKYPELARTVNVEGSKVIAKIAAKDRLVLFGSTGSNYGALVDQVCTEETVLRPVSLYGETKTQAEEILLAKTDCIAYRFATAFGLSPRLRLDLLVNDFVCTAIKMQYLVVYESHFMRTFIHVRDIAHSFLFALRNQDRMRGEVFNVGSDSMAYTKAEVCQKIHERVPFYLHLAEIAEDADKRNYKVSYEKIGKLGFSCQVSLEQGIDELVRAMEVLEVKQEYSNV